MFSSKKIKGFMNSVGIDLKPEVAVNQLLNAAGVPNTFMGVNIPMIAEVGTLLNDSGVFRFGKFSDPRATIRAQRENKVVVSGDSGDNANRPVPSTRNGQLPTANMAYDKIKKACLESGKLFEDPDFPAVESSLFYTQAPRKFKWLRPHEIVNNPEFVVDGVSRFDVKQGELGDCWLLAAVACLSLHDDLFQQVVPISQSFKTDYCGCFKFVFWHFGEWREVVVDDRLPTYNGQLVFMHSVSRNEFWSALMEKAYAKLCGSYEALKGGTTSEALEDFTGGMAELFDLREKTPKNLLDILLKAESKRSLMACSIDADPSRFEARLPNGLIMGHAYSVTGIRMCDVGSGKIPLLRIRNPWGNESEWKGAWSDNSREWQMIDDGQWKSMGLTFEADGEFWMSYQDFTKEFQKVEICHLGPQSLNAAGEEAVGEVHAHKHEHGPCVWEMNVEHGEWKARVNAGGCRNYLDTFWTNPQFNVTITDPDEDDEEHKGTLIVGLMQKDRRTLRKAGMDLLTIGYAIYELPKGHNGVLPADFFKYNKSIARSPTFINLREVTGRHRLDPGNYVIVPSTFKPNEEADFMIRMFAEKPHKSHELDENTTIGNPTPDVVPQMISDDQVEKLRNAFVKVAGDDNEIDADELKDIINAAFSKGFTFDGFSLETSRSLISMMDFDRSGRLNFEEFQALWELLRVWKTAFKKFDADQSGTMNSFELRSALKSVGFNISNNVFASLAMRFSKRDGSIGFDDYVMCCARLRTVFELFIAQPKNSQQEATFNEAAFVNAVLYI